MTIFLNGLRYSGPGTGGGNCTVAESRRDHSASRARHQYSEDLGPRHMCLKVGTSAKTVPARLIVLDFSPPLPQMSGFWFHALSCSILALHLNNEELLAGVSLRLGASLIR